MLVKQIRGKRKNQDKVREDRENSQQEVKDKPNKSS